MYERVRGMPCPPLCSVCCPFPVMRVLLLCGLCRHTRNNTRDRHNTQLTSTYELSSTKHKMTVTPHMTSTYTFLLLALSSYCACTGHASLLSLSHLSSFSFLSFSLIESCCCCVRVCVPLACVSLRFFSSLLSSSSFICCPWGARRWGEIRGRIEETDQHLTVCVMNRSRCWGTSLAMCLCFCPSHDPIVPSHSVHIT